MAINNEQLMDLIREEKEVSEILSLSGLSKNELLQRLSLIRKNGYYVDNRFYANGDNTVKLGCDSFDYVNGCSSLYTQKKESAQRVMVISDIHLFNKYSDEKYIDYIYDYCQKNNIHIILNCGDFIDSMSFNKMEIEEQLERFLDIYPEDNNILSYFLCGNHEVRFFENTYIDIPRYIERNRFDIKVIGFFEGRINIKNDYILLHHSIKGATNEYISQNSYLSRLKFYGHSHVYKVKKNNIFVPSLSSVAVYNKKDFIFSPQALDVTMYFDRNGKIQNVQLNHLLVDDNIKVLSEVVVDIDNSFVFSNNNQVEQYPSVARTLKR